MHKWLRGFIFFLFAVVVCVIAWSISRQHALSRGFDGTRIGASETEILVKLGKPWRIGQCGQMFGGDAPTLCAKEYLYASPYAPVRPEYWAFRFDEKKQLIQKYRYVSP